MQLAVKDSSVGVAKASEGRISFGTSIFMEADRGFRI